PGEPRGCGVAKRDRVEASEERPDQPGAALRHRPDAEARTDDAQARVRELEERADDPFMGERPRVDTENVPTTGVVEHVDVREDRGYRPRGCSTDRPAHALDGEPERKTGEPQPTPKA